MVAVAFMGARLALSMTVTSMVPTPRPVAGTFMSTFRKLVWPADTVTSRTWSARPMDSNTAT